MKSLINIYPHIFSFENNNLTFYLKLNPGSKLNKISNDKTRIIVHLSDQPIAGKANLSLKKILSKSLNVSKGSIVILAGNISRTKRIAIQYKFTSNKNEEYYLEKWLKLLEKKY